MTSIGGNASISPGQLAALYAETESARRAQARPAAPSPVDLAFGTFGATASRQASLASISRVVASDFLPQLDRLADRLDESAGHDGVLGPGEREALLGACTSLVDAYASGAVDQAVHVAFQAAVIKIKAAVSVRVLGSGS